MLYDPVELPGWRRLPVGLPCHQLRAALGEGRLKNQSKAHPGISNISSDGFLTHSPSLATVTAGMEFRRMFYKRQADFAVWRLLSLGVTEGGAVQ